MKKNILALVASLVSGLAAAEERGAPIFGDSFDVVGTFAENWVSKRCFSADGVAKVQNGACMHWRGTMPLEFVVEMDVTVTFAKGFEQTGQGWGGFGLEGYHFSVQPTGSGFCVWKLPGDKHSSGKYAKIPDFEPGKCVHQRLVRKVVSGGVKYSYFLNGTPAGEFIAPMPEKQADGGYKPLSIVGYHTDLVVDNFLLSKVMHEDDSPNMVFNSGFEYAEDDVPTYYGLYGRFNFEECPASEYETRYLKRFAQDTTVSHSGKASLRVLVNDASRSISIAPWQTGTVKGQPGVFSVWMKASTNGLPVEISFSPKGKDGRKTVNVTTEWQRYEVTCTELSGKGTYTPVHVNPVKPHEQDAVLWIDDLQAEIVQLPPEGKFDTSKTYATPYKPSELDKGRFLSVVADERKQAEIVAKKLPAGMKPTVDLDAWKDAAFEVTDFWMAAEPARVPTAAYVACDDDRLYVGFRNYRENPASLLREKKPHDAMIYRFDGLELFFQPDVEKGFYHFMATANGDRFDCYDNDIKWDGNWTVTGRENVREGSVDLLVTIPFADFAVNGFSGRWAINLCRNEISRKGAEIHASTAKHKRVSYKISEKWNSLVLPPEVAAKWSGKVAKAVGADETTILGRLDFYMNEAFAQWRVAEADGTVTVAKRPLSEIPMGTNVVSFSVNGKTFTDTVVKLPYKSGATQVNKWARCLVKDGEKVFLTAPGVGCFGTGWFGWKPGYKTFDTMADILVNAGFRQSLGLVCGRDKGMAESRAMLDAMRSRKLQYVNWCDFSMPLWEKYEGKRKDKRLVVTPSEMMAFFRPYEDFILTNLVVDEPELSLSSDFTQSWLEYMKSFYPYVPVQMNNTVMGIPSKFAGLKTDILMLDDYLTNQEGRTVASVVKNVDIMRNAEDGKPCWYFIVSHNATLHYKLPSYAEQIAQSWGCICAGCTGLAWYFELPVTKGSWRAMKQVNREVQALKEVILSEEVCADSLVDQPKSKMRHLTRTLKGDWYVLTCNIDKNPLEKVTFTLPKDAPQNGTVEVLAENRTIPLKNGVFSDGYAGYTRHLYKIRK